MTRGRKILLGAGVLVLSVAYCATSKKPSADTTEPGASKGSTGHELTSSEVPLVADYERSAKKQVSPDNYREQIKKMERELELVDGPKD